MGEARLDDCALAAFIQGSAGARIQHTPRYLKIIQQLGDNGVKAFVARESGEITAYLPVSIRCGPAGGVVNSLPYQAGYGGVLFAPGKDDHAASCVISALEWAKREGAVAATICTPPLGVSIDWYSKNAPPTACFANFFQHQSLRVHPIEQISGKRRSAFKNEIKRANASGITLSRQSECDHFDEWYDKVYLTRCHSIGIRPITRDFYHLILQEFCPGRCDVVYAIKDSRVVSGTVFTYDNEVLDYYSTAATEDGAKAYAPTLVISEFIEWAITHLGCKWLNWQSSPSRESGVYAFKKRWGSIESEHQYLSYALGDISSLNVFPRPKEFTQYDGYFLWPLSERK